MATDIRSSMNRLFHKVILFDIAILAVLIILSSIFSTNAKHRLAEQLADAFRAPLISGDNRQVISDMSRAVFKDFTGASWQPRDKSLYFSLPENIGEPNAFLFRKTVVKIFFDENMTEEAGKLYFFYSRWTAIPLALLSWLLLVALSIIAAYYEQRRMLREYNLSLESAINKSKADMAAQVAHDIRSPLVALDAALKDTTELPEKKRIMVRHAVNRIRDIANNLLEKNRQQTKATAANMSATGNNEPQAARLLSSLVDAVITEKRLQFESKPGIDIDFKLTQESYGLFARVQPVEFGRMVSNLVNNAVEVLGDKGSVKVGLAHDEKSVVLTVADNGKGIPPEILAKLGQRGETHGKVGGSGLGLYHARTTVEGWGGSLNIASELGKGTTVTIKLPKAETPEDFVSVLELGPGKSIVVLDDDATIHQVWQGRFDSARVREHNIEAIHFSEPDKLRQWVRNNAEKSEKTIYLFDYELIGYKETGLSLTEELGLSGKTILVSSRCEEKRIIDECGRLKVRMISKGLADFVPISIGYRVEGTGESAGKRGNKKLAVLIDDDALVRMNWEDAAEAAGINLKIFSEPDGFLTDLDSYPKDTPIYIDSELSETLRGENIAVDLRGKGYTDITLETGHNPERFAHLPWLKVMNKESPWRS